jgi:hypothetical protein
MLDADSPWRELGPPVGNDTAAQLQQGSPAHAAGVPSVHGYCRIGSADVQCQVSAPQMLQSCIAAWPVCHLQQATQYSPVCSHAAADKLHCPPVVVQLQPAQPFTAVGDEREMAAGSPVAADASGKHRWSKHSSGFSPNRRVADGPYDCHIAALRWVPAVSVHARVSGCQGRMHRHVYLHSVTVMEDAGPNCSCMLRQESP